jgi:hypothetical protein
VVQSDEPHFHTRTLRQKSFVGILIAVTLGLGVGSAKAASLDGFYGVNVQQVFSGSPASWQPQLSAMQNGGLQLARIDARWGNVEPNPPSGGTHHYSWSLYDSIVGAMAQHGLRWYPIVAYSTDWSGVIQGDAASAVAPQHLGDFGNFSFALAKRYGRGGTFWAAHPSLPAMPVTDYEIWNEENSTTFLHPQDYAPEAYADLYMAGRAAIRAADPQAKVIVGGLALGIPGVTDEIQFIQRMWAHRPDLRGNVDGVGLHPYQHSLTDTYMRLARFRQALDQLAGPSVPIEITELGWATTSVSEADRAKDLGRLARQLPHSDCNVDQLLPYTWLTQESNPGDPEDWFGIWNHDGSGKPSGIAYLDAVELMRGMTPKAAPAAHSAICHPRAGGAAGHGPKLRFKVLGVKPRHWVRVAVSCRPACIVRLELLGRSSHGRTRLAARTTGVRAHPKVLKLRIRGGRAVRRKARVHAVAQASSGITRRTRLVRIR